MSLCVEFWTAISMQCTMIYSRYGMTFSLLQEITNITSTNFTFRCMPFVLSKQMAVYYDTLLEGIGVCNWSIPYNHRRPPNTQGPYVIGCIPQDSEEIYCVSPCQGHKHLFTVLGDVFDIIIIKRMVPSKLIIVLGGQGYWLSQLSTIIQLYRGGQFYWRRKLPTCRKLIICFINIPYDVTM